MPRAKATSIRSDRVNSVLREIANSNLPIASIDLKLSGDVSITFYQQSLVGTKQATSTTDDRLTGYERRQLRKAEEKKKAAQSR